MTTRFVTWTMVAMYLTGLVACGGSDSSSIPLAPTPSPPPAPTPSPPPPRALAVDLRGDYALRLEVGSSCEQVPTEFRTRTYEARIEYSNSYEATDNFRASLSGATFHDQPPIWIEVIQGASGPSVWLNLVDTVIFEEPERGTYFMGAGANGVASVEPTNLSTISARFTGHFNYCVATPEMAPQHQCSFETMLRSLCKSENSRWTLTRR
jgi:hypothetical protein